MVVSQLKNDLNWSDTYPETEQLANGGKGLPKSKGTSYDYVRTAFNTYCLTAYSDTQGVPSYYITSANTAPQEGECPTGSGGDPGGGGNNEDTLADNTPIQNVTSAQCAALPVYNGSNNSAVRTVTDSRGTTRTYRIAKLADNKCWMLDNLRLGSTSGTTTLTPANSNIASNFTLPPVVGDSAASVDAPRVYGPVPGDTSSGATNYGWLYNWSAATAGETSTSITTGNAPYSICAKGWRLPTGGVLDSGIGEFSDLDRAFGGTGVTSVTSESPPGNVAKWQYTGPFKGVFSGYAQYTSYQWIGFSYPSSAQGAWGDLWSSSAHPSEEEHALSGASFAQGGVMPNGPRTFRDYGMAIRCIKT